MSKHTQGKWQIWGNPNGRETPLLGNNGELSVMSGSTDDENVKRICVVDACDTTIKKKEKWFAADSEREANAKLIAAAPKMLEALKKIANWEIPETGEFWDKQQKEPKSYATLWGSNGERDFIKNLAIQAISKATTQ